MKPTIKVPLYRIEGVKGLQVGRCGCVTQEKKYDGDKYYALGSDGNKDYRCEGCFLFPFDHSSRLIKNNLRKRLEFVSWAYSTPERRG